MFLLFRLDDAFFNGVEFFGFDKARLLDCFLFLFCESFVLDDAFDGGFFFAALFDYDFFRCDLDAYAVAFEPIVVGVGKENIVVVGGENGLIVAALVD